MKTVKILVVFFLLSLQFSCTESGFYSNDFQRTADLANKAEMAIAKNQLALAENYYAELFELTPNPSGRDIWNRAMIAKNTGNKTLNDSMVRRLFFKGYKVEKIAHCFDTSTLTPLITEDYLRIKKEHEDFVEKIVYDDQQANIKKAMFPEKWIKTSLKNIIKVKRYVDNVDSLNIPYFSIESAELGVVFIHFYQMWNNSQLAKKEKFIQRTPWMKGLANVNYESFKFTEFLKKQVELGNYSKNSLAYLLGICFQPFPSYAFIQVNDKKLILYDTIFSSQNLKMINQNRATLLSCSHEEYMKKARFMDSLKYNGEIFTIIENDSLYFHNYIDICSYNLVTGYRFSMSMADPSVAGKQIKRMRETYKKDSAFKAFNPLKPI
jgi:hypothetical protein